MGCSGLGHGGLRIVEGEAPLVGGLVFAGDDVQQLERLDREEAVGNVQRDPDLFVRWSVAVSTIGRARASASIGRTSTTATKDGYSDKQLAANWVRRSDLLRPIEVGINVEPL